MIYKIRVLGDSVFSFLRLYYCIRNHSWSDVNDYLRNCIGLPVLVTSFQQHDMSTNGFWCLLCKILAIWLDDLHFCFIISLLEIYWLNASSWLNSLLLHAELMLIFQLFSGGFYQLCVHWTIWTYLDWGCYLSIISFPLSALTMVIWTWHLVAFQAAAYGLPMVATRNGGPVDIHRVLMHEPSFLPSENFLL